MIILTCVADRAWESLAALPGATWVRLHQWEDWKNHPLPDAFFISADCAINELPETIPVFMDAASVSSHTPAPVNYVTLWPGFIERTKWEVGAPMNEKASRVLQALNITPVWVSASTGLIASRVVAMIINEAYFALEDGISTKDEIDIAMKLGTGYPYGPFEWSRKIGMTAIANLLLQLSPTDKRYQPCALLLKESYI